ERDLLEMIRRDPDSEEPRLVYADWLLEQGDSRGDLIALQCAEARWSMQPTPADRGRGERRQRIAGLLETHVETWLTPLIGLERIRWELADDGACDIYLRRQGRGQPCRAQIARGFLARPMCVSSERLAGHHGSVLLRFSPTLYEPIDRISRGRSTELYEARVHRPTGVNGRVALKVPREAGALDAPPREPLGEQAIAGTAQLLHEQRVASLLDHPNIVRWLGWAGWGIHGYRVSVMEWLDGRSLHRLMDIAGRPMPSALAVAIVSRLCLAVHHLHTTRAPDGRPAQLVHRLLRPDHVFLTHSGEIKLLNLADVRGDSDWLSPPEHSVRDPHPFADGFHQPEWQAGYSAPELVTGGSATQLSDQYACGAILHGLLCGRHPFYEPTSSLSTALYRIERGWVEEPTRQVRDIPEAVEAIVMRAMDRQPSARFPSLLAMHQTLEDALAATGDSSEPAALAEQVVAVLST
ncbi:MAG: TIGR02996 domain-containing protein, partial [Myxococcota bacterium]